MKGHKTVRTTQKVCTLLLGIPLIAVCLPFVLAYAGLVNLACWAKCEWQKLGMDEAEQKLMKHKLMKTYGMKHER